MTAADLVRKHVSLVGSAEAAQFADLYTEDASMDFPYAPQHHTGRLGDRAAILRFLGRVGEFFSDIEMGEPKIFETSDPNVVIAEYTGASNSKETGKPYRQNYIAVVTVRDGKIAHIREYYNPVRVLVTTGEIEEPGS